MNMNIGANSSCYGKKMRKNKDSTGWKYRKEPSAISCSLNQKMRNKPIVSGFREKVRIKITRMGHIPPAFQSVFSEHGELLLMIQFMLTSKR
jgi:hypothetical protein